MRIYIYICVYIYIYIYIYYDSEESSWSGWSALRVALEAGGP